jgi:uncharacterized protein (TIGR03083 family)
MPEADAAAYAGVRRRVSALVSGADAPALEAMTPATPAWRVRDALAHMIGVCDDVVAGRLEGITSDAWTGAQVDARRDVPVLDLLAEWDECGAEFVQLLVNGPPVMTGQAVYDAATHEHDIRHALGASGARDSDAIAVAWQWLVDVRTSSGAPAIHFVTDCGDDVAGVGEPVLTVRAPRFELFRATTGRRSRSEMEAYGWEPAPDFDALVGTGPLFTIRAEPLGE